MSIGLIKILDCTLRDGGYLNDWMFGEAKIQSILDNLYSSGIDFIECGFLKECIYDPDKTFFSKPSDLEKFIKPNKIYTLMVNFGEYDIKNFSQCENKNIKIRVAFKKHNQKEALVYIKNLIDLGWDVFVNPMLTNTYNEEELDVLLEELDNLKPSCVTIVDTLGNMYEQQVIDIFEFIHARLKKDIALGFHSHNSMQLSFSNVKTLLGLGLNRTIIVDSCLYGMGRGAGNLCTELITKYINDTKDANYKILSILKIIDSCLKNIYKKTPWGYSTPYYIAAIHGCHPNYAAYLTSKNISDEKIDEIISQIPDNKKISYDENLIKNFL